MAFFPRTVYDNDASFSPLFRLLEDFDKHSRRDNSSPNNNHNNNNHHTGSQRSHITHWQPRFDVRETTNAYELYGELPGLTKENLQIEFPQPQTLTVRGRTERNYTNASPQPGVAAIEEGSRRSSFQATVEDESAEAETSGAVQKKPEQQQQQQQSGSNTDKVKYWLSERSIGEFSRTFDFPTRVDQDAVSASLKDGILSVSVPKAKKHEPRRIAIN
jgi:HSP20 family molecular chaperone IbpA